MDAFWTAVEQTVAGGELVFGNSHLHIEDALSNSVIILPRIVTRLHPVNEAPEQHTYRYMKRNTIYMCFAEPRTQQVCFTVFMSVCVACRDLAAWDMDFVINMLQEFLQVSSAKTFPSLAEYRILPDKVQLLYPDVAALCMVPVDNV